ncbi:MAG: RdgB/HAM1 family non-canonical purine NTP pyrophosphatase [Porticoccaceae bacterium]|nr:RdgB/HAM1 family non-canonical purine NTP pyrophosphatase [Porticoccaceae bacterium]
MDVVLASSNAGKIKELQDILAGLGVVIIPQQTLSIPDIEETGLCFVENAILKARNAALLSGKPAIADDSGLEVDLLDGRPGIYSARYGGEEATDSSNNQKLLEELGDSPLEKRSARYQCIIVYMRHANDPTPIICQGSWEGHIAFEPRGSEGFGYDPLFYLADHNCHAAEMNKVEKNRISHRGKATAQLLQRLEELEFNKQSL